jgi:hypothetical protein
MQPFNCQHGEQHISNGYEIAVEQEIHIFRLELQDGPLNLLFPFLKYIGGSKIEI